MREIKRRKRITETSYQCEVCEAKFLSSAGAINCEKSHMCNHELFFELDNASEGSWWFNVRGISSTCRLCKMELGSVNFEDIEENQEILKRLFNVIDEYNKSIQPEPSGR